MNDDQLVIYCDGGARGNPGLAAIGVVVERERKVVHTIKQRIGETTNNQAEYRAVYTGLDYCLSAGAKQVEVYGDSELIINQLRGEYKIKNKELAPWFIKIQSLANQIGRVSFNYIPREKNSRADALVN